MKSLLILSSVLMLCASAGAHAERPIDKTPSGQKYARQCQDPQPTPYQAKICERLLFEARVQLSLQVSAQNAASSGQFARKDLPQMSRVDELRRVENRAHQ